MYYTGALDFYWFYYKDEELFNKYKKYDGKPKGLCIVCNEKFKSGDQIWQHKNKKR